ncbi:hypothetical protein [Haloarchaeobius amylolyticus]|uniref:hypothetical protein n=1 Tax=Haloarchaeobius amylolyticus TaxID=1198296 RepID=UPI00226FC7A9|nr:hypothetical protein [Haloarchaeobius amylolyticus]
MRFGRTSRLLNTHGVNAIILSVAGFVTVIVGVQQGIFHVAPGYQGTINAGGEALGRREWLLAGVGAVGVVGAALSIRRKRLSVVPVVGGGIVLFEVFRTIIIAWNALPYPLFTETTYRRSGEPVMFILGAEPFMLIAGGSLLFGAGIAGIRGSTHREDGDEMSSPPSTSA